MGTDKEIKSSIYNNLDVESEFFVRKCTLEDLEGVIEVNEKELPEDYPFFFYKSILDNYADSFLVACKKNNPKKIIGYIMWRIESAPSLNGLKLINKGHLVSIAVSETNRRKGVSTALLSNSMPEVLNDDLSEYVLEVRVSNYPAVNLYKKFDYTIHSIKKNYYRDGENAYFMIKKVKDI
ncbi:MAG: GNAT family N-acetyltransferase [Candidatus Lokiarchaeota archaeon]|nr:GNAT family N-acetyltransferase [Candidatus Lokiarchaeota archaeon]